MMNEDILYTLAGVAVTIAGFSGVVIVLPLRDKHVWLPKEIRMLRLLIADSLIAVFLALLPVPLALANWSSDAIWRLCSALLGTWFILGDFLAVRGELRDRADQSVGANPLNAPIRYGLILAALLMGLWLWLSASGALAPAGQALYVLGLMVLIAIAAVEFIFFVGLTLLQGGDD